MLKFILLFLLFFINNLYPQLLLNINSFDTYEQAMGDTSLLVINKDSSFLSNPGINTFFYLKKINLTISESFFNNPYYVLTFQSFKSNFHWGIAINYFNSSEFPYVDIYGNTLENINYYEYMILLNYSAKIINKIGSGINIKILSQHLYKNSLLLIDIDWGIICNYLNLFNRKIYISLNLKNPINNYKIEFNTSYKIYTLYKKIKIYNALSFDTIKFNYYTLNIGLNFNYKDNYSFLMGYKLNNYILNHFSIGFNIKLKNLSFSYSLTPSTFYNQNSISLNYYF